MSIRPVVIVGLLLSCFFGSGCTSQREIDLMYASKRGDLTSMHTLIEAGARLNVHGLDDSTPLISAISGDQYEAVQLLLEAGADPNFPSGVLTPLYFALSDGRTAIASILIRKSARFEVPESNVQLFREKVCAREKDATFMAVLREAGYTCSA
ncbi:ankyrin repeat domain-containing protein [Roseateles sp. SL47]|uniref:ankyrin repeat domain-containing protein n=1 Tax=Roseateles sp. SL47 TaxID=2995138 RepID=UPI00227032C6|nr:ankyrin repeat domain-containing protein [Roseateles sp. SL47]WAC74699.1 ankyrin repeat domain-containing protein [Roseateles sp. SL47]